MNDRISVDSNILCWTPALGQLIDLSLQEDLAYGDLTTALLGASGETEARILCREPVVVCGLMVAEWVLERAEPELSLERLAAEGEQLGAGNHLALLSGPVAGILRVERTVLNFLQRLCAVATLTRRYVEAVEGTAARVIDTRKTLPGWRSLDKYAVRAGGGGNHRMDLGTGILIKDNHIAACGSVGEAVRRARAGAPHTVRVEVEVEDLAQVKEALEAGAELLLLDNMTPQQVVEAARLASGKAGLEVSGGVTLETIRRYAEAGAEYISVGALTHSAPAVDLSLEV